MTPEQVAEITVRLERLKTMRRRIAWLEQWKAWREDEPLYDSPRYSEWLATEPAQEEA